MKICGGFFEADEFVKHFQECMAQQPNLLDKATVSSSSEENSDESGQNFSKKRDRRCLRISNGVKGGRAKRDSEPIYRRHSSRRMFENLHVYKNPVIHRTFQY